MSMRFLALFAVFTFGPGAACALWLTRSLDGPRRLIVVLSAGVAAAAVMIDVLGRLDLLALFPYLCAALSVGALLLWPRFRAPIDEGAWTSRDFAAIVVILLVVFVTGRMAFAHRLSMTPEEIAVYGDYDSLDLTYYAAVSAEASHTVPPTASYYAGRELNYAYYPQLILAMVHRFGGVPMLSIYFSYAWPTFLALGSLSGYLLVRSLLPTGASFLAIVLILVGGDFSYIAARYLPHPGMNWDYVLWPTNFLSPTMEVLHFNSWTPSLPLFFGALWAAAHGFRTRADRWMIFGALLLGVLFQFKPFAFLVVSAALAASFVFAGRDRGARWRYAGILALAGIAALPFVYRSIRLYADRRSELRMAFFVLPERMLIKLDLLERLQRWSEGLTSDAMFHRSIFLLAATALFFVGGLGIRWFGLPGVWRALRGRVSAGVATWRLLAWGVVAGVGIPFVIVTEPYNDTLQFYQVGLYLLWIFTAAALAALTRRSLVTGALVTALAVAASLPSSIHYLTRKWSDNQRGALSGLTRTEIAIAEHLRTLDSRSTVVLNNRPLEPSLMAVVSERRVVLAWGRYAVGSGERLREVDAFYGGSRTLQNTLNILRKHHVTHVIVHPGRDRVPPEVLTRLTRVMGDEEVVLYSVPADL